jgi:hypothetical protein
MRRQKTLSEPDRRAIDLLLNNAAAVQLSAPADPVPPERLKAVKDLLSCLDQMPPIDLPIGLAQKTIDRIDQATAVPERYASWTGPAAFH